MNHNDCNDTTEQQDATTVQFAKMRQHTKRAGNHDDENFNVPPHSRRAFEKSKVIIAKGNEDLDEECRDSERGSDCLRVQSDQVSDAARVASHPPMTVSKGREEGECLDKENMSIENETNKVDNDIAGCLSESNEVGKEIDMVEVEIDERHGESEEVEENEVKERCRSEEVGGGGDGEQRREQISGKEYETDSEASESESDPDYVGMIDFMDDEEKYEVGDIQREKKELKQERRGLRQERRDYQQLRISGRLGLSRGGERETLKVQEGEELEASTGSGFNVTEPSSNNHEELNSADEAPPLTEERSTQYFPGEQYKGPDQLQLHRGRITKSTETTSQVTIRYFVTTAIPCPCENDDCKKLVNVGKWGVMGGGSTVCVHCGAKREGDWEGVGYGFMGKEDLLRHLKTGACRAKRGLKTQKKKLKHVLGPSTYYKINNPDYIVDKDRNGKELRCYQCYIFQSIVGYRSRYMHHLNAHHGTASQKDSEEEEHVEEHLSSQN